MCIPLSSCWYHHVRRCCWSGNWTIDRWSIYSICHLEVVYASLATLVASLINIPGFYINLPAGAVTGLVLCFTDIPDERKKFKAHKPMKELFFALDLIGFSLFAPACIMFLMALQWGGIRHPWISATILGLFGGSIATATVFAFWEQRLGKDAMIPMGMLKKRIVYSSC